MYWGIDLNLQGLVGKYLANLDLMVRTLGWNIKTIDTNCHKVPQ